MASTSRDHTGDGYNRAVDRRLLELRPTPIARVRPGELVKIIGTIRARGAVHRAAQREQIALETAFLNMSRNPQPYNHGNHRSDYNDYWLCTYCAADYTLVTTDGRLRTALRDAGCEDPRLVSLDEGIALGESWLAGR
jgi:hypothetical protein